MIINSESLAWLKTQEDNTIDSIVTDPPYGLSFMGKKWDYDVPSVELWKEALRVLKPGGYLLSFSSSRTYHRMAVNVEDAGFEIRDQLQWIYSSGFPKSYDIGKAYDKKMGNEREIIETKTLMDTGGTKKGSTVSSNGMEKADKLQYTYTKGTSQHEGWGTALKPAQEPIVLARKHLSEKTVVDNLIKWGTVGLNIDECRVGDDKEGRFPANVIHNGIEEEWSKYFYSPKVNKKERNIGCDDVWRTEIDNDGNEVQKNGSHHPTVKPVALMAYLCRLITPKGGTVLDIFNGSGSTGMACKQEGFEYIGIEMNPEYCKISEARIKAW